jgi:hypothetical protein
MRPQQVVPLLTWMPRVWPQPGRAQGAVVGTPPSTSSGWPAGRRVVAVVAVVLELGGAAGWLVLAVLAVVLLRAVMARSLAGGFRCGPGVRAAGVSA